MRPCSVKCLPSILAVLASVTFGSPAVGAQEAGEMVASVGTGGTYYCIVSRCDTGTTFLGTAGYGVRPSLMVLGSVRWHECFDCDRFVIAEGSLQLRHSGEKVEPFVAIGAGLSTDPDFMGNRFGPHAAVGAWLWPSEAGGVRSELRGRRLGKGNGMAELSVAVARRFLSS